MNILSIIENQWALTCVIVAITIGYALYQFKYIVKLKSLKGEIYNFNKILNGLKNDIEEDSEDEVKDKYFQELDINNNWKYLKENIQDHVKVLKIKKEENIDGEIYFNEGNILDRNFNIQSLNQVGPTLVGIGILGTFIGLALALTEIGGGEEAILESINKILPNMSLAFITSIAGMSCSLIFTGTFKRWQGYILKEINELNYNMLILFPTKGDLETTLFNIQLSLEELSSGLSKNLGTEISKTIESNTKNIFGKFGVGFEKAVGNLGNDIAKQLHGVFNEGFIEQFERVRETIEESAIALKTNTEAFKEILEKYPILAEDLNKINKKSVKIFETANKSMEAFEKYMNKSDQFLLASENMLEVQKNMATFTDRIENTYKSNLELYENSTKKVQENLNSTNDILAKNNDMILKNITEIFNNTEINIAKNLNNFKESIVDYTEKTSEVENQLLDMIGKFSEKEILNQNNYEQQYNNLKNLQNNFVNSVQNSLTIYDAQVTKIAEEMVNVIENVKKMS